MMAFDRIKYEFALLALASMSDKIFAVLRCSSLMTALKLAERSPNSSSDTWSCAELVTEVKQFRRFSLCPVCPVPLMQSEPQSATKIYKADHNCTMPYRDSPRFTLRPKKKLRKSVDLSGSAAAAVLAVQHRQQCNIKKTNEQPKKHITKEEDLR